MEAARSMSEERLMDWEKRVRLLEERAHRVLWSAPQTGMSRADELAARYGEYVDKTTAAGILGVTRATVYAMLSDGRIQSGCGGRRVSVRSMAEYMERSAPAARRAFRRS